MDLLQNDLEETATGTGPTHSRAAPLAPVFAPLTAGVPPARLRLRRVRPGSDIADYLVKNVAGMETSSESQQVGQELIKLGVMRPVSCSDFQPRPGNFYFFMVGRTCMPTACAAC